MAHTGTVGLHLVFVHVTWYKSSLQLLQIYDEAQWENSDHHTVSHQVVAVAVVLYIMVSCRRCMLHWCMCVMLLRVCNPLSDIFPPGFCMLTRRHDPLLVSAKGLAELAEDGSSSVLVDDNCSYGASANRLLPDWWTE